MERLFNTREYKRSRHAYTAECAFEYFGTILVTDAFLARLLKQIGLSDASVGVLSSLVSVSFLFQLFSVLLMQRMRKRPWKKHRLPRIRKSIKRLPFLAERKIKRKKSWNSRSKI